MFLCVFFLSFAAKNSRVKADKTALRLSHLPKCGRKHESRINCFSQNRKTFLVVFGLGTKLKGRRGFPPPTSASWIAGSSETGNPPSTFMDEVKTWAPPKSRGQEMGRGSVWAAPASLKLRLTEHPKS